MAGGADSDDGRIAGQRVVVRPQRDGVWRAGLPRVGAPRPGSGGAATTRAPGRRVPLLLRWDAIQELLGAVRLDGNRAGRADLLRARDRLGSGGPWPRAVPMARGFRQGTALAAPAGVAGDNGGGCRAGRGTARLLQHDLRSGPGPLPLPGAVADRAVLRAGPPGTAGPDPRTAAASALR